MPILLRLLLVIVFLKLLINAYRLIRIKMLFKQYTDWLFEDRNASIVEKREEVISLWKHAGVHDSYCPRLNNAGYGKLLSYKEGLFFLFPFKL